MSHLLLLKHKVVPGFVCVCLHFKIVERTNRWHNVSNWRTLSAYGYTVGTSLERSNVWANRAALRAQHSTNFPPWLVSKNTVNIFYPSK